MKIDDVRRTVTEALSPHLVPAGFKWVARHEAFIRRSAGVVAVIFVPILNRSPEFGVSFLLGIRLVDIENVYNEYAGVSPSYQSMTMTCTTHLDYFTGEPYSQLRSDDTGELRQLLNEFAEPRVPEFLEHFERYSDPKSLCASIDTESAEIRFNHENLAGRAMHSVALAWFHDRADYDRRVLHFRDALKGSVQQDIDAFEALLSGLEQGKLNGE